MDRISTIAAGIKPVAPIVYEATVLLLGWDESSWAPTPQWRWQRSPQTLASLPALGPWAPPAERDPSLESIYRGFPCS